MRAFYLILLFLTLSIWASDCQNVENDDSDALEKSSKCKPYLTNYGFLIEKQSCDKFCCGSCFERFCCSNKTEALKSQKECLNNYDPSSSIPILIKNKKCDKYFDRYGDVIEEKLCKNEEFCSGSCSNRYCDFKESNWLDQTRCPNQFEKPSTTSSTTSQVTSDLETTITFKTTRHKKSTKRPHTDKHLHKIFNITLAIIILFCMFLFVMIIRKRFCSKELKINKSPEVGKYQKYENDKPPAYPGY